MATVDTLHGWRVVIYSNDHTPAHVHVIDHAQSREAKFELNCPGGPVVLTHNWGFQRREVSNLAADLAVRLAHLCRCWRKIRGAYK